MSYFTTTCKYSDKNSALFSSSDFLFFFYFDLNLPKKVLKKKREKKKRISGKCKIIKVEGKRESYQTLE